METHLRALLERDHKPVAPNAFGVTKADDFSDEEIDRYWVEPGSVSAIQLLKPARLMPMVVRGGKGSGKTHLFRHFSLISQSPRRHDEQGGVRERRSCLGVYIRCDGLNATRFSGKAQSDDTWQAVFQYFFDLWLAQALLSRVGEAIRPSDRSDPGHVETLICKRVCDVFDEPPSPQPRSIHELLQLFHAYHREIDIAINNVPLTRKLDIRVRTSPSRLIFAIPEILSSYAPNFSNTVFLYLLDEMENLSVLQQKYVNTLIRHRKGNCSFRLGARLYGIKTYETLEGETNRAGSEFDVLELDAYWWRLKKQYRSFSESLCIRRLKEAGFFNGISDEEELRKMVRLSFDEPSAENFYQNYTLNLLQKYKWPERPYFKRLRDELSRYMMNDRKLGIVSERDAEAAIKALAHEKFPLLEKINLYLFYKDWARGADLKRAATKIRAQCREFIATGGTKPRSYFYAYQHFSGDMLAQLMRETGYRVRYVGFDTFTSMSSGLPRNLLIILKNVFDWAIFNDERPFSGTKISIDAQERAVIDSSQWFFEEARPKEDADQVQRGIDRLATLFRGIRYSDKPSECSLSTFSCSLAGLTDRTKQILKLAEDWSMLIWHKRGQKDRNSKRVDEKYQLSPMLAPKWELPLSCRGALALSADEVNAIFGESGDRAFESVQQVRMDRMNVPFQRSSGPSGQPMLPGIR